jgi:two-component system response regulator FlrC
VVELNIPPLRERREDILPLAAKFIEEFDQGPGAVFGNGFGLSRKLSVAGQCPRIAQRDGTGGFAFPQRTHFAGAPAHARARRAGTAAPPEPGDPERLDEIERQAILQALRQHNSNRTETAKALGISRRALIYKLQKMREAGYLVE